MKIHRLKTNPKLYSSNVYFILGDWNRIDDVNCLIDTGADDYIIEQINKMNTGVGKKEVDKVILTHNHFDHTSGLVAIKKQYNPEVLAAVKGELVDKIVKDGEVIKMGDSYGEILKTPGHSSDSICIYCPAEKVLFSGDTPIMIHSIGGSYTKEYVQSLKKLAELDVEIIYPGHGDPITENPKELLQKSLKNVLSSKII